MVTAAMATSSSSFITSSRAEPDRSASIRNVVSKSNWVRIGPLQLGMSCRRATGSGSFLDLEKRPNSCEVVSPSGIQAVAAEHCLYLTALAGLNWTYLGYSPPSANDSELLAVVLHLVEEVCKVPGGVGSAYIRHKIRISDIVTDLKS